MNTPWPAPAKINLFLHITGRRPDGYHELQTAFQFLDLADELQFTLRSDDQINRSGSLPGLAAEDDLSVRAARRLREVAGLVRGVDIDIRKNIPDGGGLGGGSSDAATTLVALNALWDCGLDVDALAEIGLELGADVPVFVRGEAAFAEGVGERLQAASFPEGFAFVVHPGVSVPTAKIFTDPQLTRNTPATTMHAILAGGGHNDCEAVARARFPAVDEAFQWLDQYGEARLTGTGACVFALFDDAAVLGDAARRLPTRWRGFASRTLNRSPLLDRLAQENA